MKARDIGISIKPPVNECSDSKCPFHGTLPIRGTIFQGKIVSSKAQKTAVARREFLHYIPKYERYERRHSKIMVYNPECVAAKEGDVVTIGECRPLSKTKHFVVLEKVGE